MEGRGQQARPFIKAIMFSISVDITPLTMGILKFPAELTLSLRKELKNQVAEVTRTARKEHRYGSRTKAAKLRRQSAGYRLTGNLARSVDYAVKNDATEADVHLESGMALNKQGDPYGVYVHEGHGGPGKSVRNGYPYVWEPDRFLDAALKKQEPQIRPAIERAVIEGLQKAGLQ